MTSSKIAVVGLGYWGKNLVRNFFELGALHAICDQNTEELEKFQKGFAARIACQDYQDLLKSTDVEAVVIATPAARHYEMAKAAILAGKDVFVEKPLALKVEEAQELIQLAEDNKRILMVDHILRYHPAVIKLKELIDAGVLGKLRYIYSNRLNIGRLRREENILWSFAPHDISVILHLAEESPSEVDAFGEAYLQEKVYDTTMTFLTFSDRLKSHIYVSWLHPYKQQKLIVVGDLNMAVFDDMEMEHKLVLYPHRVEWIHRAPMASKAEKQVIEVEKIEPLKAVCQHFLECLRTRATPRTDGREALAVLSVLDKAQKSLDQRSFQRI